MNWLLILVVLLVAGNIVWGFFRGFLRVVYSMAAWILILVFVTFATPYVADWMTEHSITNYSSFKLSFLSDCSILSIL